MFHCLCKTSFTIKFVLVAVKFCSGIRGISELEYEEYEAYEEYEEYEAYEEYEEYEAYRSRNTRLYTYRNIIFQKNTHSSLMQLKILKYSFKYSFFLMQVNIPVQFCGKKKKKTTKANRKFCKRHLTKLFLRFAKKFFQLSNFSNVQNSNSSRKLKYSIKIIQK